MPREASLSDSRWENFPSGLLWIHELRKIAFHGNHENLTIRELIIHYYYFIIVSGWTILEFNNSLMQHHPWFLWQHLFVNKGICSNFSDTIIMS